MNIGLRLYLDFVVFLFGAVVGSFLNVCIHRIPRNESIVSPPSHCPKCQTRISWLDNIPLVSWVMLGGKCRRCGARISGRYVMVEMLTALLFLAVWLHLGGARTPFDWRILPYWILVGGLILATFIDLEHYIIPDEITVGGALAGLLASAVWPLLHGEKFFILGVLGSVQGLLIGSALILWVAVFGEMVFRKEAMGFGDVKFMGMIGAFLGWHAVIFVLVASSGLGAVIGSIVVLRSRARRHAVGGLTGMLMFWKRKDDAADEYLGLDDWRLSDETDVHAMGSSIPYGPYLATAAVLWIFVGEWVEIWFASVLALNQ